MSKTKLDNKKEKVGIETSFRDKIISVCFLMTACL